MSKEVHFTELQYHVMAKFLGTIDHFRAQATSHWAKFNDDSGAIEWSDADLTFILLNRAWELGYRVRAVHNSQGHTYIFSRPGMLHDLGGTDPNSFLSAAYKAIQQLPEAQ